MMAVKKSQGNYNDAYESDGDDDDSDVDDDGDGGDDDGDRV